MQNVHGKEIDLLRTTVKIPGKRPPRAVATVAPAASPKTNGLTKDRSGLQLGIGNAGATSRPVIEKRENAKDTCNCWRFSVFPPLLAQLKPLTVETEAQPEIQVVFAPRCG